MALPQLNDEQISTWTQARKDDWWYKTVYRGDVPQLTFRSGITGFLLGGVLSATALYIGAKTGIGIGVGLTSAILSFATFRMLHTARMASDLTILENNCAQSIAASAGHMAAPLFSSLSAYMLVTKQVIPWWQLMAWLMTVAVLGVLVAFPLKRRFINYEQLPFPEGRACGVLLDSLYTGDAAKGIFKARMLALAAMGAGLYQTLSSVGLMRLLEFDLLRMNKWTSLKEPWTFQARLDTYYYLAAERFNLWTPRILGTDVRQLGLRVTLDAAMLGVGGLIGIRIATSCLLGAFINFAVLAPMMIARGDIVQRISSTGGLIPISRAEIVNQWALWWAVTMMVVGSLLSLVGRPEILTTAFNWPPPDKRTDRSAMSTLANPLRSIELPLALSLVGVPFFCGISAVVTHAFFGVPWLFTSLSLPLILVLAVICANSMALTSWAPTGGLAKITQFSMGLIDRSNPAINMIPAAVTAEVASNAANLLSDIKTGYMLGAKPRQQAIGHIIGVLSGTLACIPLYFLLFLPAGRDGARSTASIVSEQFAMPAAMQWKGVAELIANGTTSLPRSALVSAIIAAACAAMLEIANLMTRGRVPLSSVAIGLGVVLPPEYTLTMWVGAMLFWWGNRRSTILGTRGYMYWREGRESICAGLICGSALIGISDAIVNVFLL